ncbi:hypothetical protein JCM10207_005978 [Rhodosporidiobolus poonsookiae]
MAALPTPITPLDQLLNLDDFERSAEATLKPKSWAYYASSADNGQTYRESASIWNEVRFRPRVMRDVGGEVDLRTTIGGCETSVPLMISPAAMGKLAHKDGELSLAKAAGRSNIVYCPSNHASVSHKDLISAAPPSTPFFFQLYTHRERWRSAKQLAEAKQMGFKAVVVTVDVPVPGNRELDLRTGLDANAVELANPGMKVGERVLAAAATSVTIDASQSWKDLAWIKEASGGLPLWIKGIHTVEDALLAYEHGAAGIYLSSHGGRQVNTAPTTLEMLLELRLHAPHLLSSPTFSVVVDGGIRRGTDAVKALCLGATAVSLGRPFMFSLVYGQEGPQRVVEIMRDEMERCLRLLGVRSVGELRPEMVNTRRVERRFFGEGSKL